LVDIDAALDLCERLARVHAGCFYPALELLPAYRRRALCAIWAFVHRLSEIVNEDLPAAGKLELLAEARAGIPRAGSRRSADPVLVALRDTHRRFPLPSGSLDDLIDGFEALAHEDTCETFEGLVVRCRLVAGSIGRLIVAVLGSCDPAAAGALGDDLAVAIHLTELLPHLLDEHESGRAEGRLNHWRSRHTRDLFDRGLALVPLLDARGAAFVGAIVSSYERLLDGYVKPSVGARPLRGSSAWVNASMSQRSYRAAALAAGRKPAAAAT
jgi:phytoene synthase